MTTTDQPKSEGSRARLLAALPLQAADLTIRGWARDDLDQLAAWPPYPFPYEAFRFRFADRTPIERDDVFAERERDPARITLTANRDGACIGYLALLEIDWCSGTVGNLGIRVHPSHCGEGIGTALLRSVLHWGFERGLASFRLDVAASNARAIRCYEKAGFREAGEIWRPAPDLQRVDLSLRKYDFLRAHVRFADPHKPELRFLIMEAPRRA